MPQHSVLEQDTTTREPQAMRPTTTHIPRIAKRVLVFTDHTVEDLMQHEISLGKRALPEDSISTATEFASDEHDTKHSKSYVDDSGTFDRSDTCKDVCLTLDSLEMNPELLSPVGRAIALCERISFKREQHAEDARSRLLRNTLTERIKNHPNDSVTEDRLQGILLDYLKDIVSPEYDMVCDFAFHAGDFHKLFPHIPQNALAYAVRVMDAEQQTRVLGMTYYYLNCRVQSIVPFYFSLGNIVRDVLADASLCSNRDVLLMLLRFISICTAAEAKEAVHFQLRNKHTDLLWPKIKPYIDSCDTDMMQAYASCFYINTNAQYVGKCRENAMEATKSNTRDFLNDDIGSVMTPFLTNDIIERLTYGLTKCVFSGDGKPHQTQNAVDTCRAIFFALSVCDAYGLRRRRGRNIKDCDATDAQETAFEFDPPARTRVALLRIAAMAVEAYGNTCPVIAACALERLGLLLTGEDEGAFVWHLMPSVASLVLEPTGDDLLQPSRLLEAFYDTLTSFPNFIGDDFAASLSAANLLALCMVLAKRFSNVGLRDTLAWFITAFAASIDSDVLELCMVNYALMQLQDLLPEWEAMPGRTRIDGEIWAERFLFLLNAFFSIRRAHQSLLDARCAQAYLICKRISAIAMLPTSQFTTDTTLSLSDAKTLYVAADTVHKTLYKRVENVSPITAELWRLDEVAITEQQAAMLTSKYSQCVICCDDYEQGNKCTWLGCMHVFHSKCVKKWFKKLRIEKEKFTCPLCKCIVDLSPVPRIGFLEMPSQH